MNANVLVSLFAGEHRVGATLVANSASFATKVAPTELTLKDINPGKNICVYLRLFASISGHKKAGDQSPAFYRQWKVNQMI
jgi:hypothetical protein